MVAPAIPEGEFIALFETVGPIEISKRTGVALRSVFYRRRSIEARLGRILISPNDPHKQIMTDHAGRLNLAVENGIVLIGSDCHYWNLEPPTAHRAFVKFCKDLKPEIVILNGDVLDGATISRHPPINWEERPSLIQEIEACQERLGEIEKAAGKATRIWTLGNHDGRFETKLATVAPEYARVHGMHLKDHFPSWQACWSVWINDETVIKHRFRGGIHATHNNALWAGKTIITGHLHSLKVTPLTDYGGTRWGVDTGCIADPWGPQFEYLEDSPRNWRSGFVVLTFVDSRLMWPEICHVIASEHVEFRGKVYDV